ncbi:MAG TPA: rhodanese-like domain-containing protein [Bryobacteraceae bacterium]|nr:rhodanese-like domain-containing protein [Bryobacteraceae bacterium]
MYLEQVNRRAFLQLSSLAIPLFATDQQSDPWSSGDLIQPADLAQRMKNGEALHIICVVFPVLYRQRHITGALLAGPGSKPEGIAALDSALKDIPRGRYIVLYCGCCPMQRCPNIRPAYAEAKKLGFRNVLVLDLPQNFHTDWVAKGYPVDSSAA